MRELRASASNSVSERSERRGAGGNRTPVRRGVTDRATTIPEIPALRQPICRVRTARGLLPPDLSPMSGVFPSGQCSLAPSTTTSVAGLSWSGPAWPRGSQFSSRYLIRSGGESEVSLVGASVMPRFTSLSNSGRTNDFSSRRRNRSAPRLREVEFMKNFSSVKDQPPKSGDPPSYQVWLCRPRSRLSSTISPAQLYCPCKHSKMLDW